jgi:glycosyltransferase involved in cell wall biosynthesis
VKDLLTIVIPCKNEEGYIGNLLNSLSTQRGIEGVRIIIADAGSTDKTLEIINSFNNLNIEVIGGGLPAVGRNSGLELSTTKWTLFIDADAEFNNESLISECLSTISGGYRILAAKLNSKNISTKAIYMLANFVIKLSKYDRPFSVGIFTMVCTLTAKKLGGFPQWAMHCEDYLFSREFKRKDFVISKNYVYSDNRRFKKIGYFKIMVYFIKNIFMRNNINYFKKDINYWL